jgi:Flp pilus assembly protein TadB
MTDRYRIAPPESTSTPDGRGRSMLRPALWLLLILSAAANATVNTAGASPLAGVGFGLITLASAAALVVHHYRHRTR